MWRFYYFFHLNKPKACFRVLKPPCSGWSLGFYSLTSTTWITFLALSLLLWLSKYPCLKNCNNGGVSFFNLCRILHNAGTKEKLHDRTQTFSMRLQEPGVPCMVNTEPAHQWSWQRAPDATQVKLPRLGAGKCQWSSNHWLWRKQQC